jgi:hypothetical protein
MCGKDRMAQPQYTLTPGDSDGLLMSQAPAQYLPQPPKVPWDPQRLDYNPAPDWPDANR